MFIGAIPKACAGQVVRAFPFERFTDVFVCCSGSFRLEQAIGQAHPTARLHSNDVSLITCAIGELSATGRALDFRFGGEMSFANDVIDGMTPRERTAALLVAGEIGRYTGSSEHARLHVEHLKTRFADYVRASEPKLSRLLESVRIGSFRAVDFREHAAQAAGNRAACVIGFPPTYKGGYEKLYKFLDASVEWTKPTYDVWDPKQLGAWLDDLAAAGVPFAIGADQTIEGRKPAGAHVGASRKALFLYVSEGSSTFVREELLARPFRYSVVEASGLTRDTDVRLVPADSQAIAFLKNRFLAKGIAHTTGALNFLVYLDGQLAGGFIYTKAKYDPQRCLYLLSDFSVTRERRVSKLIAMLAASMAPVQVAERRYLIKVSSVCTTAFTAKPVSMKYRGIYRLAKRGSGYLNYESDVRPGSPTEVYRDWFDRFATADSHRAGQAA